MTDHKMTEDDTIALMEHIHPISPSGLLGLKDGNLFITTEGITRMSGVSDEELDRMIEEERARNLAEHGRTPKNREEWERGHMAMVAIAEQNRRAALSSLLGG